MWIVVLVLAFDQATKAAVRATLGLHESVEVIPGLLDITHVRNEGAAFGILNTADFAYKTPLLALIAVGALVAVGVYAASLRRDQILPRVGLALILAGAAGNLIDRLSAGWVVDFVDVYWRTYHFWAFNVADSAISVGVAIMILDTIGVGTHVSDTA
jgi:signal peptidase II